MAKLSAYGGQVVARYVHSDPTRNVEVAIVQLPSGKARLLRKFPGLSGWTLLGQAPDVETVKAHVSVRFPGLVAK